MVTGHEEGKYSARKVTNGILGIGRAIVLKFVK